MNRVVASFTVAVLCSIATASANHPKFADVGSMSISGDLPSEAFGNNDKCTAILGGRLATTDGSTVTTHNADCAECDWRINKVPAMDWAPGSMRPVYKVYSPYPRSVRDNRGHTWSPDNIEPDVPQRDLWRTFAPAQEVIGYIPQIEHTYALIEGMYAIMNEHQVAIGESTCAAKFWSAPVGFESSLVSGKALFEANELSQIALERSRTAREAVKTMGELAFKYGFYGSEWDVARFEAIKPGIGIAYAQGEAGEALTVADPNEAWMFHIMPDDTGASAIWVAQRIPDDHISVVANQFVIKEVDPDSDDFMYSPNLWSVAEKHGLWNPSMGKLHFLKTYAPARYHPNYSNKRVWRVLSLAAPSLNLPFDTNQWADEYPFSVKVDHKLKIEEIMNFTRDVYHGVQPSDFDPTTNRASGPYGDPNRWDPGAWPNLTVWDTLQGEYPRTISLFRTSYSMVAQPRRFVPDALSRVWIAMHAPDTSTFAPIYVAANTLPEAYTRGTMTKYNSVSAWWNHCAVSNYVARFYNFAINGVRKVQRQFEAEFASKLPTLEAKWMAKLRSNGVFSRAEVDAALARQRGLATTATAAAAEEGASNPFHELQERIRDGDINSTAKLIGEISKMVEDKKADVQQRADDVISRSNAKAQEARDSSNANSNANTNANAKTTYTAPHDTAEMHEKADSAITQSNTKAQTALDTANTKARDGIDRVNNAAQQRIDNITSAIKAHTPNAPTANGQHPADVAGGVAKAIVNGIHSTAHTASETANGVAKSAVDSAHSVSKSTVDAVNAHLQPTSTGAAAGPTYTTPRSEIASVIQEITDATVNFGQEVSNTYKDLLGLLITTYRDGYIMTDLDKPTMKIGHMFYPRWWLDAVGYFNVRPNTGGILFQPNAYTTASMTQASFSFLHVIGLVALGAVGFVAGRKSQVHKVGGDDGVYRQYIGLTPRSN